MGLPASSEVELALQAGNYLAYKSPADAEVFGYLRDGPHAAVGEAIEHADDAVVSFRQFRQQGFNLLDQRQAFDLLVGRHHRAELGRAVPGIVYLRAESLEGAGKIKHLAH